MEVASPLSFGHSNAGNKRQFPYSQGLVEARSPFDSSPDEFVQQRSFKRRRFNMDVTMDGESENNVNHQAFPMYQTQQKSLLGASNGAAGLKRCRGEATSPQYDLHAVVEAQAAEIETLKSQKVSLETNLDSLKVEHEKVVNENKILKRAVTIQQERQNQAATEIEAARRYKFDAEDRIKKMEQLIFSLRYHLQAQSSNPANDFMGFPPRHPDVY